MRSAPAAQLQSQPQQGQLITLHVQFMLELDTAKWLYDSDKMYPYLEDKYEPKLGKLEDLPQVYAPPPGVSLDLRPAALHCSVQSAVCLAQRSEPLPSEAACEGSCMTDRGTHSPSWASWRTFAEWLPPPHLPFPPGCPLSWVSSPQPCIW